MSNMNIKSEIKSENLIIKKEIDDCLDNHIFDLNRVKHEDNNGGAVQWQSNSGDSLNIGSDLDERLVVNANAVVKKENDENFILSQNSTRIHQFDLKIANSSIQEDELPNISSVYIPVSSSTESLEIVPKVEFEEDLCLDSLEYLSSLGSKRFECFICASSFSTSNGLSIHMRTHTDERPYSCHLCSNKFRSRSNLVRHVHAHTKKKLYKCDICSKPYANQVNCRRHMYNHAKNGFT